MEHAPRAKQKELPGKVIEVNQVPTTNNRSNTYITADYVFPNGRIKRKKLNLRSVLKSVSNQLDKINLSQDSPPPDSTSTETDTINTTNDPLLTEIVNDQNRLTAEDYEAVVPLLLGNNISTPTTTNAADDADSSSTNTDESDVVATVVN